MVLRTRAGSWMWLLLAGALLAGCASPRRVPAPVEDRGTVRPGVIAPAPAAAVALPGAENAGKPGYFTVRPGDTLIRIALETGQNWRDVARWNNIDNPNVIEVGQVLRVAVPGSLPSDPTYVARTVPAAPASPAPPAASAALPPASGAASAPARPASAPAVAAAPAPAPAPGPATPPEDEIAWAWPIAAGPVLAGFDEQKNKGIDIGGRAGEPVLASADGKVVYAGAGLRGYGNLIILKHNNTYLTAYAHNQTRGIL